MRRNFVATVTSVTLIIFVVSACGSKPEDKKIENFGDCDASWSAMLFTMTQTFVPPFSVLKKARIPLANPDEPEAHLLIHIYKPDGTHVATSEISILGADTEAGCNQKDALSFKFSGNAGVTPGDPYRLRIEHVKGGNASIGAIRGDPYADGALFVDGQKANSYDLAFGLTGGGSSK